MIRNFEKSSKQSKRQGQSTTRNNRKGFSNFSLKEFMKINQL